MPDVGDVATATLTVSPFDGTTSASLTVYDPAGNSSAPSASTADSGATWTASVSYDEAGWWLLEWEVTGTGAGVQYQRVYVAPAPDPGGLPAYATLERLKSYVGIQPTDVVDDEELTDILDEVSREIDSHCSRRFYVDTTATARTYPTSCRDLLYVDDIASTTGLLVDGSAWPVTGLTLLPRNGIVDGVEGWPYTTIERSGGWSGDDVTVTARWGWPRVPAPVRQSCLILAAATLKLREQPGGPGGFGEWGGIVRARDNPHATIKLAPYRLDPALVA